MKQSVSRNDFFDAFRAYGRQDNFSREGLEAIFEYLEEMEESTGEELELDVVAICCDYNEASVDTIIQDYNVDIDLEDLDEDEQESAKLEAVRDFLNENTSIIAEAGEGFIFACF